MSAFMLLFTGVLLAGLGVPLARGAIKRNRLYGYRTPATLSDDRVWYPANRASGLGLVCGGIAQVLVAGLMLAHVLPESPAIVVIALVLAVLPSIVAGSMAVQRAASEIERKG